MCSCTHAGVVQMHIDQWLCSNVAIMTTPRAHSVTIEPRTVACKLASKTEDFLHGDSQIQLNNLKLNGRSAWDANLPVIREEVIQPTVHDGNNSIIPKG